MEKWLKNQCDIYNNYKSHSFKVPLRVKTFFKNRESENVSNLIEDNMKNAQLNNMTSKRYGCSERRRNNRVADVNGNIIKNENISKNLITENQIWRRLSLQSYKKRKQEKQEQKTKPLLPSVLRTYDKRGIQKTTTDWL